MKNHSVNARKLNKNIIVFIAFATVLIVLAGLIVGLGADNSRAYAYADSTEYISNSTEGQGDTGQNDADGTQNDADSTQNDATTAASSAPEGYGTGTAITGPKTITTAGRYYLANDVNLTSAMQITATSGIVYLHLNGHTLRQTGKNQRVIIIPEGRSCNVVLEDLEGNPGKITGGNIEEYGGGIWFKSTGTFTMNGGTITGNTGTWGAGISNVNGTLVINDGVICDNFGSGNGGAAYLQGPGYVNGGKFYGNKGYSGGALYIATTCTISGGEYYNNEAWHENGGGINFGNTPSPRITGNVLIHDNFAYKQGGGLYCRNGVTVDGNVSIYNNTANLQGGGAYLNAPSSLTGTTITNNTTSNLGGGVYFNVANSSITNGEISNNTATNGGGVYFNQTGTITGTVISGNTATTGHGGGVYFTQTGTIKDAVISDNTVTDGSGGGVYAYANTTISGGSITKNTSALSGGGICFIANGTISNISISENNANFGGGVYFGITGKLSGVVNIDWNVAKSSAGGIYITNTMTVEPSTELNVRNNTAESGYGGGILYFNSSGVTETFAEGMTVTGNKATKGGGIYIEANKSLTFNMTGGTIAHNAAKEGGGVYLTGNKNSSCAFNMTGGSISNNGAEYGGGVYLNCNTMTFADGKISNNAATYNGAGVYLAGTKAVLIISSSVPQISGNVIGATWAQEVIVPVEPPVENPDENPVEPPVENPDENPDTPIEGDEGAVTAAEVVDKGYREITLSGGKDEAFGIYKEEVDSGRIEFSVALDASINLGVSIHTESTNQYASVVKVYAGTSVILSPDNFFYAGEGIATVNPTLDGGVYIGNMGNGNAQVEFDGKTEVFPALDLAMEYANSLESSIGKYAVVRMLDNAKFYGNQHMVVSAGKFIQVLMEGFTIDAAFNPDYTVQGGVFYAQGSLTVENGTIKGYSAENVEQQGAAIYFESADEDAILVLDKLTVRDFVRKVPAIDVSGYFGRYDGDSPGIIYIGGKNAKISNCEFVDNQSSSIIRARTDAVEINDPLNFNMELTNTKFNNTLSNFMYSFLGEHWYGSDSVVFRSDVSISITDCEFLDDKNNWYAIHIFLTRDSDSDDIKYTNLEIDNCLFGSAGITVYLNEEEATDVFDITNCTFDGQYNNGVNANDVYLITLLTSIYWTGSLYDEMKPSQIEISNIKITGMQNSIFNTLLSCMANENTQVSISQISIIDSTIECNGGFNLHQGMFELDGFEVVNSNLNLKYNALITIYGNKDSSIYFSNILIHESIIYGNIIDCYYRSAAQAIVLSNCKVYDNKLKDSRFVITSMSNNYSYKPAYIDGLEFYNNEMEGYCYLHSGRLFLSNATIKNNHSSGSFYVLLGNSGDFTNVTIENNISDVVQEFIIIWHAGHGETRYGYSTKARGIVSAGIDFQRASATSNDKDIVLDSLVTLSGDCRITNNKMAGEECNVYLLTYFYEYYGTDSNYHNISINSRIEASNLSQNSLVGIGFYKQSHSTQTSVSRLGTSHIFANSATTDLLDAGHFYADDPNAMIYQDGINVGIRAYNKSFVNAQVEYNDKTHYYMDVNSAMTCASALQGTEDNMPLVRLRRDNTTTRPITSNADSYITIELDGFNIDRSLYRATTDGYVFRVQGWLKVQDSKGGGIISGGNNAQFGGGFNVFRTGTLTLEGVTVDGNKADSGAGLYVAAGGRAYLNDTVIKNNQTENMGAGIYVMTGGTLEVRGGIIRENIAGTYGGGIYAGASSYIDLYDDAQIMLNSATYGGGAYVSNDTDFIVHNATIMQNKATYGGGMYVLGGVTIDDYAFISGNTTLDGRTANNIYLANGSLVTIDGTINEESSIGVKSAINPEYASDVRVAVLGVNAGEYKIADGLFTSDNNSYGAVSTGSEVMLSISGVILSGIKADLNLSGKIILETDSLDVLRQYLTVTLLYSDGSSVVVNEYDYKLLCETNPDGFVVGNNSIIVLYSGCTARFTVKAYEFVVNSLRIEYEQGNRRIFTNEDASLLNKMFGDELKVYGVTKEGIEAPLTGFTLSLKEGDSFKTGLNTIVVTYNTGSSTVTGEFDIICDALYLERIVVSAQSQLFEGATFGNLRDSITVTGFYTDGTPFTDTITFTLKYKSIGGELEGEFSDIASNDAAIAIGSYIFILSTTTGTEDGVAIDQEFTVEVVKICITSIEVEFDQSETVIYASQDTSSDALKAKLGSLIINISGVKNNGDIVETIDNYTLSTPGLVVGQNYITVTVEGATAEIVVVVTAVEVTELTVKFDPSSNKIYTSATLDSLRGYLTVTGKFNDGTTGGAVTDYTLSFDDSVKALAEGDNTITLKSGSLSATFVVNAVAVEATGYEVEFNQGETVIFTSDDINCDKLHNLIKIKVAYNDGTSDYIEEFELQGVLTAGTVEITALLLNGETVAIQNVEVTAVTLKEIIATFNPIEFTVFTSTQLDAIKSFITLEGINNDGSIYVGDLITFDIKFETGEAFVAGPNTIIVTVSANAEAGISNEVTGTVLISAEEVKLASISAEFDQNDITLYRSCPEEELFGKLNSAIKLTGTNNDGSTINITEYTLMYKFGSAIHGQNILVITYEGLTTEIAALFNEVAQIGIQAEFNANGDPIYTSHTADKLLQYVTVTGINNDESTFGIAEGISIQFEGVLVGGTNNVKVFANGFECDLTITEVVEVELTDIRIQFEQGELTIYRSASYEDAALKALLGEHLTVIGIYNDGIERNLDADKYTLARVEGEWVEISKIKVTPTDIPDAVKEFDVTTTAVELGSLDITFRTDTDAFFVEGFEVNQLLGNITGTEIKYLTVVAKYNDGTQTTVEVIAEMLTLLGVDGGREIVPDDYNVIQVTYSEEGKGELTGTFDVYINSVRLDTLVVEFDSEKIETIYTSTPLDKLKDILALGLTVSGTYNTGEVLSNITEYNVSLGGGGSSLPAGDDVRVNISYGGQVREIIIKVVKVDLARIEAEFNAGGKVFYTSNKLDDINQYVTVTGYNNDGTQYFGKIEYTLSAEGYLNDSGLFYAGAATVKVTVTNADIYDEFAVDIIQVAPERLEVTFAPDVTVFEGTSVEDILTYFTVKCYNNDGTEVSGFEPIVALTNGELIVVAGDNEFTITACDLTTTYTLKVEPIVVINITADFTQGETKTYMSDDMESLKSRIAEILKVSALYNNQSTVADITGYELSIKLGDALQSGQNIITVTYEGATCDIIVVVDPVVLVGIEVTYDQSDVTVYTSADINKLEGIYVESIFNDDNREPIKGGYTLSLTTDKLQAGGNTVTVSYNGFEDTFNVEATQVEAIGISVTFNQSAEPKDRVFISDDVNGEKLRSMTTVVVTYNDGTSESTDDYILIGELKAGESVSLTVTYTHNDRLQATIESVYVTTLDLESITATFNKPDNITIYTSITLEELKQYITVIGYNNDGSVYGGDIGDDYTLSFEGEFNGGNNTIKVSYNKNQETALLTDITVEMVAVTAVGVNVEFNQGETKVYVSMDMAAVKDALLKCLTVNIAYNDGSEVKNTTDYELVLSNGEVLVTGNNMVKVVSDGIYSEISINATAVEMVGIEAEFMSENVVYTSTQMNALKNMIKVWGVNNDGTKTEAITDYIVSIEGGIKEGENKVTITYFTFSYTIDINVTAVKLDSLEAEFNNSLPVYISATLYSLRPQITVTGVYNDGSKQTMTEYQLSFDEGMQLKVGDNDITIEIDGVKTTITVEAEMPELLSIEAEFNPNGNGIFTSTELLSLKAYVTLYGYYADGSRMSIQDDFDLEFVDNIVALQQGDNLINVVYSGKTCEITVYAAAVALSSITAEIEQGNTAVKAGISAVELKELISDCITLTGINNDGTAFDGEMTDYVLEFRFSEVAIVGVNIVTVRFGDFTSDIHVKVDGNVFTTLSAEFEQPTDAIYTSANLDALRPYLTVKIDGSVISDYLLEFSAGNTGFSVGPNTVCVKYGEASTVVMVTITAVELESIIVSNAPTKTQYVAFDTFNTSGMVIVANYNDGTSIAITDYIVEYATGAGHLCFGDSAVTIKYNEKTTTVVVSVGKKLIAAPQVTAGYMYNGVTKNAEIARTEYYTLTGELSAKNAGTYTIKATLTDNNYGWMGSSNNAIDILWTIDKAVYEMNGIKFEGQEIVEDGQPHSLAISGTLPTGVIVSYDGNGKTVAGIYTVTAKFSGNANYEPIEDMEALLVIKTKQMNGDNIIIDNIEDGISPDYKLEVKDITDEELGNIDKSTIESAQEIKQRFDVVLTVDGEIVQPNGTVQVKLLIDESLRTQDNLKVYCVSNTGALMDVNAIRDGNYMVFEAEALSRYIIVGDVIASVGEIPEAIIIGTLAGGGALALLLMITLILVAKKKRKARESK